MGHIGVAHTLPILPEWRGWLCGNGWTVAEGQGELGLGVGSWWSGRPWGALSVGCQMVGFDNTIGGDEMFQ